MGPKEYFNADKKTLRNYGLVMTAAFVALAVIFFLKDKPSALYLAVIALLFLVSGLTLPRVLKPLYVIWMTFAFYLSMVMTYLLLTVFFYLIMSPVGLIMRLFGKDLLSRKFPGGKDSYWVEANVYQDDIDRYSKPY